MERITITTPIADETIRSLKVGDLVYITGEIYTARDAAHKRIVELLEQGGEPPFTFEGNAVYYAGPCPARPGEVIGSIGPTTSGRMDDYSPRLIERGLKVMIGKGLRSKAVIEAIKEYGGIYLAAVGGAAAYIARSITEVEVIAFDDLGPEAVRRLEVKEFPAIVAIDSLGRNIYEDGRSE